MHCLAHTWGKENHEKVLAIVLTKGSQTLSEDMLSTLQAAAQIILIMFFPAHITTILGLKAGLSCLFISNLLFGLPASLPASPLC